jgi:glycosyltransferase involved in cell wall biosynthesis
VRVAIADLFFAWPPHGGACTDVFQVATGLQRLGHDVRLFAAAVEGVWERGSFDPDSLPFPSTPIAFTRREFNRRELPARFHGSIGAWGPDAVLLADAFFLKPWLIEALDQYPLVGRYYAYELTCPRDFRLFRNGATCPNNYLRTPDECRRCTAADMAGELKRGRYQPWVQEYIAARAWMPAYHRRLVESLSCLDAVVVYNEIQKAQLEGFHDRVRVVPGGVDLAAFPYAPPAEKGPADRKIVLMVGRAEDPAKGYAVLHEAADRLARTRDDFELQVTSSDPRLGNGVVKVVPWRNQAGLSELYREADICVVPSIWEEPFGLVAVEAMASGRPVCAARVGGLHGIVVPEETGYLHDPQDAETLAQNLARLLDDPALRRAMGDTGRRRAETVYDWARIVEDHYAPLLEEVARGQ